MKTTPILLLLLSCAMAISVLAQENLIRNCSFESSQGYAPSQTFGFPDDVLVASPGPPAGSGALSQWSIIHGSGWGEFYWYWGDVSNQPSHDGARFINLTSGSGQTTLQGVAQSFEVIAGQSYTVTYFSRARVTGARILAAIQLDTGSATGDLSQESAPDSTWRPFTFSFVPDSTTTATLSFRQAFWAAGLENGVFLDSVSVTSTETPLSIVATSSTVPLVYSGAAASMDLINSGQSTLTSASISASNSSFAGAGLHDGNATNSLSQNAYFQSGLHFPAAATFVLNTSVNMAGYDITGIQSLMGWASVSSAQANQTYLVEVSKVGDPGFTAVAMVSYKPFEDVDAAAYESRVELTHPSGMVASGVDAIRFTFLDPVGPDGVASGSGQFEGSVIREIDVMGSPSAVGPPAVSLSFPPSRYLVQRSDANVGDIRIQGSLGASADAIQGRAVVMSGANSGVATEWQTLIDAPTAGLFSGTLSGVAAGGWYQIEVRSMRDGDPGPVSWIEKVGVGDIYITAGQSNSANYGSPNYTPSDDRVVSRSALSVPGWQLAQDPQPLADGSGASVWSRLGDLLVEELDIPVGFVAVGVGSTQAAEWLPATSNYASRLKPAIQSFPASGFRAILWHQGESDAIATVSASLHAFRLNSIISQSRIDGAWTIPWYIAEASFHPNTNLAQEEPVVAGQRSAIYGDPAVFFGPSTDSFHLEDASGGKLADSVHFNAAGLNDHATQWLAILTANTPRVPRNGGFEENRTPGVTGLGPLADGGTAITSISDPDSPSVIGWRILSSTGTTAANGSNGILNPGPGTYSAAVDTSNGGVLPSMNGRHVATLSSGSGGNHFLHSTRNNVEAQQITTLTVAIGVRDNPASFGNARLEILADGDPVAARTFSKADLDGIRAGSSAGAFTDASISFISDASETGHRALAVRISKPGGSGTVLDFDNVRLNSSALTAFQQWQILHFSSLDNADAQHDADPDRDGVANGLEYFMGCLPKVKNAAPATTMVGVGGRSFVRFDLPLDPTVSDSGLVLEYSHNLADWFPAMTASDGSVLETKTPDLWRIEIASDTHPKAFFRASYHPNL